MATMVTGEYGGGFASARLCCERGYGHEQEQAVRGHQGGAGAGELEGSELGHRRRERIIPSRALHWSRVTML